MTRANKEHLLLDGAAGKIECVIDLPPAGEHRGVALVAHPHPLFGGSLDNKVAQTLAKTSSSSATSRCGRISAASARARANTTRGAARPTICSRSWTTRARAFTRGRRCWRVSPSAPTCKPWSRGGNAGAHGAGRRGAGFVSGGRSYTSEPVPADSIIIHGELDETVPLANVLAWARPQELPVVVVPGADHFFHRRLHLIKSIVKGSWQR